MTLELLPAESKTRPSEVQSLPLTWKLDLRESREVWGSKGAEPPQSHEGTTQKVIICSCSEEAASQKAPASWELP